MKALFVIDVQSYFINEHTKQIPLKIADFIDTHKFDWLAFFQYFNHPNSSFAKFHQWYKMYGSPETDLVPELQKYITPDNLYKKFSFTIFKAEGFEKQLKTHQIAEMYLCGMDTDACVLTSEMEAFERGYDSKVIEDLCVSHSGIDYHNKAVDIMKKNLGKRVIINSQDL